MDQNSSQMTIEELMRRAPFYSDDQLELLKESSAYDRNELGWQ